MYIKLLVGIFLVMFLTGCATSRREVGNMQAQQLQMRIGQLEQQMQQKDEEISYLESCLEKKQNELEKAQKAKVYSGKKTEKYGSKITPKQIQIALKNAGFYNGQIDGKIGEKTKKAIIEFQKANGLTADGIVGTHTRLKLKKFLD